jgi:hypothetical protein
MRFPETGATKGRPTAPRSAERRGAIPSCSPLRDPLREDRPGGRQIEIQGAHLRRTSAFGQEPAPFGIIRCVLTSSSDCSDTRRAPVLRAQHSFKVLGS